MKVKLVPHPLGSSGDVDMVMVMHFVSCSPGGKIRPVLNTKTQTHLFDLQNSRVCIYLHIMFTHHGVVLILIHNPPILSRDNIKEPLNLKPHLFCINLHVNWSYMIVNIVICNFSTVTEINPQFIGKGV